MDLIYLKQATTLLSHYYLCQIAAHRPFITSRRSSPLSLTSLIICTNAARSAIRILEHAILQTDDNELGALEARLDQTTDILRMRQVKRGIDLVQDVHWCGLELEQGHDE